MSFAEKMSGSMIRGIDRLEDELAADNQAIQSTAESPIRFEIMRETAKRSRGGPPAQMAPIMVPTVLGIRKSLRSPKDNPTKPKRLINPELLEELEASVLKLGASCVGYTKVPGHWVFQNKAFHYQNAIMFSMEMDKDGIDAAPSLACMKRVIVTPVHSSRVRLAAVFTLKAKQRIAAHGD